MERFIEADQSCAPLGRMDASVLVFQTVLIAKALLQTNHHFEVITDYSKLIY